MKASLTLSALLCIAALLAQDPAGLIDWLSALPGDGPSPQAEVMGAKTPTSSSKIADATRQPLADQPLGLPAELEQEVAQADGDYGIAVMSLNDGRVTAINGDRQFPTASMYKLLVMYRVFQAITDGSLAPGDQLIISGADSDGGPEPAGGFVPGDTPTVELALNRMITVSSNAAAYALTRSVGGWGVIISAATELGMPNTVFTDDFQSTPLDQAHFFHLLANQKLINAQASQQMHDLLLDQTVNDRLPALLPADTSVAHKTGELPDVRNDGGIVSCPNGRYIIVLMSEGADPATETSVEARLSQMVYQYYCP